MCGSPQNCECTYHGGQAHSKEECRDQLHTGRHSYGDCGCGQHPAGDCCCSEGEMEASGGSSTPPQQL